MNKVILFSILISTLLLGAFYTYNSTSQEVQTHRKSIFNRTGMKKHIVHHPSLNLQSTNTEELNILSYRVNLIAGVQENNQEQNTTSNQKTEVNTIAHVQVDFVPENNIYELVVTYSNNHQETYIDDVNVENLADYQKIKDQKSFVQNAALVYKVYVDEESGDILSMFVPENMEPNDMMQWGTEELVNNIFPDIRSQSYLENTPQEEDSIGNFKPHIKETVTSDNIIQLEKHYDTKDYTQYVLKDNVPPAVDYNRTLFVDSNTGVVQGGQAAYEYSIAQDDIDNEIKSEDGESTLNLDINSMNIGLESNFHLLSQDNYTQKQAEQLLKFLQNNDYNFVEIQLSKYNKGKDLMEEEAEQMEEEFEYDEKMEEEKREFFSQYQIDYTQFTNDDDEMEEEISNDQMDIENKLTSSYLHQEKKNIVAFKIFKQKFDVRTYVTVYDTETVFTVALRANEKIIRKFYERTLDHCKNYTYNKGRNIEKTIFNKEYIVKPMVTLKFNVKAIASVSFSINVEKKSNSCSLNIRSQMFAELKGTASPAVARILSAGLYAKGKFLSTTLQFNNDVSLSNKTIDVQLKNLFLPVSIEVGVTYQCIYLIKKSHKLLTKSFKNLSKNTTIFKKQIQIK